MRCIDTAAGPITSQEQQMLQMFRSMNDDGKRYVMVVADNEVRMSTRHKRPVLTLIHGGPQAVPIRKRRRDRAPAP